MLLTRLLLYNFGTYAGSQELNLSTTAHQNVILIGGKNGAGKSTLLEAIRLCFHGQFADRLLTTRERYERYLLARIHRGQSNTIPEKSAFVEVAFDYGDQDGVRSYTARRSWNRKPTGGVVESFDLLSNGSIVTDVDAAHWQEFIQELIPSGVSDLFFFDGEKVQLLAEDESDRITLAEAVKNLLGTDIIEKLNADISIYRSRTVQGIAEEANAPDLDILGTTVEILGNRVIAATIAANEAHGSVELLRSEVLALEMQVQEQGGAYAKNRGKLEERKRQINLRVTALESAIRERAQGLLAVSLAPKLLGALLEQLAVEQDLRFQCVLDEALRKTARATLAQLRKIGVKRGKSSTPLGDTPEFEEILAVVKATHQSPEWSADMIHDLSNANEQEIRSWSAEAIDILPNEMKRIAEELEALYREQQSVERDLSRVPEEITIRPLLEQLSDLHKRLGTAALDAVQKSKAIDQAKEELEKAEANYRRAVNAIAAISTHRQALEKAMRIQVVLDEFRSAIIERKIKQVEKELTHCFNILSRKRLSRTININPNTFQVTIRDDHDRAISKQELSAGEKQIYAISILWALAKVSGRPLPIIIDTPLARLDKDHRALLGRRYFTVASHQVIILSTDTEIDSDYVPLLGDSIARSYELAFDSTTQSTQVKLGYFREASGYEAH